MQTTTNLELKIFEDSDYPSFAPINENFQKIDTSMSNLNETNEEMQTQLNNCADLSQSNSEKINTFLNTISDTKATVEQMVKEKARFKVYNTNSQEEQEYERIIATVKVPYTNIVENRSGVITRTATVDNGIVGNESGTVLLAQTVKVQLDVDMSALFGITKSNYSDVMIKNVVAYHKSLENQAFGTIPNVSKFNYGYDENGNVYVRLYCNETVQEKIESTTYKQRWIMHSFAETPIFITLEFLKPITD